MTDILLDLPDSFFTEEIRSGYTVTKERKELWAIELDLLRQLDSVCREHAISYMLGAGSLLGAVRHKGFIPWDDDIDVYLLRSEYNRLLALSAQFHEPYFFQSVYTDKYYTRPFSRLRNSMTTGFVTDSETNDINRGIFIDIFPIDGICCDEKKNRRQGHKDGWYQRFLKYYAGVAVKTPAQRVKRAVVSSAVFLLGKRYFAEKMDKNLSLYSTPDSQTWGNRTLVFDSFRSRRPLEDYTNLIMAEFEGFQVPIPVNYDAMLRQQYGDYMKIPEIKPASIHGELTVSTSISYRDYLKKKEN